MKILAHTFFVFGLLATTAHADVLSDATNAMCEKQKLCVMSNLGADSSAEEKQMMENMTQTMCAMVGQQFSMMGKFPDLVESAAACINSMTALSCDEIGSADEFATPECKAHAAKAAKYQ